MRHRRTIDGTLAYRQSCRFAGRPYHQEQIQKKHIRTAGRKAGLGDRIGWKTFRHSYRAWLDDTGAPMTVQKELMRHANIATTMNV